jgi:hypothetical protein
VLLASVLILVSKLFLSFILLIGVPAELLAFLILLASLFLLAPSMVLLSVLLLQSSFHLLAYLPALFFLLCMSSAFSGISAVAHDCEKAWPSLNHSILPGIDGGAMLVYLYV